MLVGTVPALIPLRAQLAPAPVPPAGFGGEEVVQLPAFEVSTSEDRGYRAVNSLAGGRMSLPLELIPSAISAITAEFIEDLVLTHIRHSYFWTVNVAPGNLRQQETIFGDFEYNSHSCPAAMHSSVRGRGSEAWRGCGPRRRRATRSRAGHRRRRR